MEWQTRFSPLNLSTQDALPELSISRLDHLGMITMVGDDKKSYLHGQVTCDVVSLKKTNQHSVRTATRKVKCGVYSACSIMVMATA